MLTLPEEVRVRVGELQKQVSLDKKRLAYRLLLVLLTYRSLARRLKELLDAQEDGSKCRLFRALRDTETALASDVEALADGAPLQRQEHEDRDEHPYEHNLEDEQQAVPAPLVGEAAGPLPAAPQKNQAPEWQPVALSLLSEVEFLIERPAETSALSVQEMRVWVRGEVRVQQDTGAHLCSLVPRTFPSSTGTSPCSVLRRSSAARRPRRLCARLWSFGGKWTLPCPNCIS